MKMWHFEINVLMATELNSGDMSRLNNQNKMASNKEKKME